MKVKTLQIYWHDKQPIFSVDIEPIPDGRIATSGADGSVRVREKVKIYRQLWRIVKDDQQMPTMKFISNLTRHCAGVNVVRWAPHGLNFYSNCDQGVFWLLLAMVIL